MVSIQVFATPISGFFKSSPLNPIALNMARAPARSRPSVILRLRCFESIRVKAYDRAAESESWGAFRRGDVLPCASSKPNSRITRYNILLFPSEIDFMSRALILALLFSSFFVQAGELKVSDNGYLEAQGLTVLVYQNAFHPVFRDQKLSAIELIQHDNRIATDGDVRLMPTPEQWDPVPHFKQRSRTAKGLTAFCDYPE